MERHYHQAYGLQIESDFRIHAFQEVDELKKEDSIIRFEFSSVNFEGYHFKDDFVIREYTAGGFLYVIKNNVAFLVTTTTVFVEPLCKDENGWQSYLLGGLMSILLRQRGFFVLHGSAVKQHNSAYLFLGISGVGKSSTAMALGQKGYEIITDDVCAIYQNEKDFYIKEGTRQVRLLEDVVEKLKVENVVALEHPANKPKYGYSIKRGSVSIDDSKIKKVVELVVNPSLEQEVKLEEIHSFERIALLKKNAYKEDLSKAFGANHADFKYMAVMAEQVQFLRITRRSADYELNSLVELIEDKVIDQ